MAAMGSASQRGAIDPSANNHNNPHSSAVNSGWRCPMVRCVPVQLRDRSIASPAHARRSAPAPTGQRTSTASRCLWAWGIMCLRFCARRCAKRNERLTQHRLAWRRSEGFGAVVRLLSHDRWRSCEDHNRRRWRAIAARLSAPLLVRRHQNGAPPSSRQRLVRASTSISSATLRR
jgi:hypothetical protein